MQIKALFVAAFVGMVAAQGSTCFDDGDCILAGGHCVKASGSITGTCSGSSSSTTLVTSTTTGGSASATGAVCFDDGDCILSGGHCNKGSNLLGNCSK